ncbi:hypothetical protein OC861_001976 [Tilletia horrida]|nr:hypothetical protein OC861_001976 [Tilletia horrida]
MPPKPRPNILSKSVAAAPIAIAPRPLAAANLPSPSASLSSSSSAGSSPDSIEPANSHSPPDTSKTANYAQRVGSKSAESASTSNKNSDSAKSLAQASKEWVLPARAKPGRKPIQKGDEDEGETKRKAQNRASQRAFRERKQAHVSELEAKLEAYERGAVQQTVDIQRAAQRVQTENDALKAEAQQLRARNAELEKQLEAMKVQLQYLNAGLARAQTITQSSSTVRSGSSSSDFGCRPPAHEIIHRVAEAAASIPAQRPSKQNEKKRKRASQSSDEGDLQLVLPTESVPLSSHATTKTSSGTSAADTNVATSETSNPVPVSTSEFADILHDEECGFCADNTPCPCRDAVQPPTPTTGAPAVQAPAQPETKRKLWYTVPEPPKTGTAETAATPRSSSDEEEAVCTGDPSMCNACQRDPKLAEFCGAITTSLADAGSSKTSAPMVSTHPMSGIAGIPLPISPSSLYTSSRALRSDSISGSRTRLLTSSSVPGGLHGPASSSPPMPLVKGKALPRLPVASLLSSASGGQARSSLSLQLPPLPLSRRQGSNGPVDQPRRLWRIDSSNANCAPAGSSSSIAAAPTPSHTLQRSVPVSRSGFQQSSSRVSLLPPTSSAPVSSVSHAWAQIRAHPRFPAYTGGLDLLADVVARRSGTPNEAGVPAGTTPAPSSSTSGKQDANPQSRAGSNSHVESSTNAADEPSQAPDESSSRIEKRAPKRRRVFVSEEGVRDALALLDGIETPNVELNQPCPCPWLKDGEGGAEDRRSSQGPVPFDGPSRT